MVCSAVVMSEGVDACHPVTGGRLALGVAGAKEAATAGKRKRRPAGSARLAVAGSA